MNANDELFPSPAASDGKKRPGRPRLAATESQRQKVERLQDELQQAQAALKISEEKGALIVGTASIRHARRNAEFARQLAAMLRAEVKSKADRAIIAELLLNDTASSPSAA